MSQNTKREVLEKLRWRYATAGLEHRRKLIDQAVELMGYHRKSAIRALRAKRTRVKRPKSKARMGRPRRTNPNGCSGVESHLVARTTALRAAFR